MRHLGWIAVTLILCALTVLIVAWPDLQELRRGKVWNIKQVQGDQAVLNGVGVFVDDSAAAILPGATDRAVVYARLGLSGDPAVLRDWLACDVSVTDGRGRHWLPLPNIAGQEITEFLAGDEQADLDCNQSLIMPPARDGANLSDLAFLLPADALTDLRIEVSAMAARPDGVSLPFTPALRPLN